MNLTRAQARAIDRYAIETLGHPGPVLMENAGRGCVDVLERLGIDGPVVVIAGKGNNAGDGLVIARHLAIRGHTVKVALGAPAESLAGDARTALMMLTPCRVPILDLAGIHASEMIAELDRLVGGGADWVVDCLLGTGAVGKPRPPLDSLIDWINAEQARTLAIDVPSGLDCDTGDPAEPTVRADHTCTFVAPKTGFATPTAREVLGDVHTVGIGLANSAIEAALRNVE